MLNSEWATAAQVITLPFYAMNKWTLSSPVMDQLVGELEESCKDIHVQMSVEFVRDAPTVRVRRCVDG